MIIQDKRTFEGGMNMDKDPRALAPNEYAYALNFHNSPTNEGEVGVVTERNGNTVASYTPYNPADQNEVIGSFFDERRRRVYYFIWGTNERYRILYLDIDTSIVHEVFAPKQIASGDIITTGFLNFDRYSYIVSCDVYHSDQFGDTLIFTDNNEEIFKINVDAAIKLMTKFLGDWDALQSDYLRGDVVRFSPPGFADGLQFFYYERTTDGGNENPCADGVGVNPTASENWRIVQPGEMYHEPVVYESIKLMPKARNSDSKVAFIADSSFKSNYIGNNQFQFIMKYVYFDGQESHWSPVSEAPMLDFAVDAYSSVTNAAGAIEQQKYNAIDVWLPIDRKLFIKTVKVGVREGGDKISPFDFFQVAEIDINDFTKRFQGSVDNDPISEGGNFGNAGIEPGSIIYRFYNNETKIPISREDVLQRYYRVPRKARALRLMNGRNLLGNVLQGYNLSREDTTGSLLYNRQPAFNPVWQPWPDRTVPDDQWITNSLGISAPADANPDYPAAETNSSLSITIPSVTPGESIEVEFDVEFRSLRAPIFDVGGNLARFWVETGSDTDSFSRSVSVSVPVVVGDTANSVAQRLANKLNEQMGEVRIDRYSGNVNGYVGVEYREYAEASAAGNLVTINKTPDIYSQGSTDFEIVSDWRFGEVTKIIKSVATFPFRTFKPRQEERFGFVYEDRFGRTSNVLFDDSCVWRVPDYAIIAAISDEGALKLQMEINHQPPEWAHKWHIVKKIQNEFYLQFMLSKGNCEQGSWNSNKYYYRGYLNLSQETPEEETDLNGQEFVYFSLNSLTGLNGAFNEVVADSKIAYDFVEGDKLRLVYKMQDSDPPNEEWLPSFYVNVEVPIVGWSQSLNTIAVRASDLPTVETLAGDIDLNAEFSGASETSINPWVMEIVRPRANSDDVQVQPFYQYATFHCLTSDGQRKDDNPDDPAWGHGGNIQDQEADQPSPQPAIVEIEGEHFFRPRTLCRDFDTDPANSNLVRAWYIDRNFFDTSASSYSFFGKGAAFFKEQFQDAGILDSFGEVERESTILFSKKTQQETKVNNLGTFYANDIRDAQESEGDITYIRADGERAIIYQENKVGYAMVDRRVTTDLAADIEVASSVNTPVSEVGYYKDDFGCEDESSIDHYGGRDFYVDIRRGAVLRRAEDGMTEISMVGMDSYFKTFFERARRAIRRKFVGAYNKRFNEYILSMRVLEPFRFDIQAIAENTVTFFVPIGWEEIYTPGQTITVYDEIGAPYDYIVLLFTPPSDTQEGQLTITAANANDKINDVNDIRFAKWGRSVAVWSENLRKWISFTSHDVDWIQGTANGWTSFDDLDIWIEDSQTARRTRYQGVDYDALIDVPSNVGPDIIKAWTNIELKSNNRESFTLLSSWSAPIITTSEGQQSELFRENFKYREGHLAASFLLDSNSLGGLYDGNVLRGNWLIARLKSESDRLQGQKVKLFGVTFTLRSSQYSR